MIGSNHCRCIVLKTLVHEDCWLKKLVTRSRRENWKLLGDSTKRSSHEWPTAYGTVEDGEV